MSVLNGPAAHVPGTDPYPWPFDGALRGARLALILAGADPAWRARCPDSPAAERNMDTLVTAARAAGGIVVAVHHGIPSPDTLTGEAGIRLSGAHQVTAAGLDAFYGGPLAALLRAQGRDLLLVAGHGLEGPVHSTLRGANDRGLECLLVADACACGDPGLRDAATRTVTMSGGIFGAVGDTASVCAALQPKGLELP